MRVPDLDWPADLFTDVIVLPGETVVKIFRAAPATPTLWSEMVSSWMEGGARSESQWPVRMLSEETA